MFLLYDLSRFIYFPNSTCSLQAYSNLRQLLLTYFVVLTNCTHQGDGCREIGQTLHADVDVL